jgi:hypothetical protein
MKRPSEYMMMTDGVTRLSYERELNKYIDYLEEQNKQLNIAVSGSALYTLKEFSLRNFDNVAEMTQRLTTGNVAHHRNTIIGLAKRCSEFIQKHY